MTALVKPLPADLSLDARAGWPAGADLSPKRSHGLTGPDQRGKARAL